MGSEYADLPEEETIRAYLEHFQPKPSRRFYQRMSAAPWRAGSANEQKPQMLWWRRPVIAIPVLLAVILLVLAIFSPPSLRATAARMAQFFIRTPANLTSFEITPGADGQLDYDFDQSILEAQEAAGFPIQVPKSIPPGLWFNGAQFVSELNTVFLDYRTEDSRHILRISIQNLDGRESYAGIGDSAEVESVQIGEITGEYVVGGWKITELDTPHKPAVPGVKITLEANWDPAGQTQILRWQQSDLLYEILSVSASSAQAINLTKADLLALAEGMQ